MLRRFFVTLVLLGLAVAVVLPPLPAIADSRVSEIQRILTDLGYDPGSVDGAWGGRTERAARKFVESRQINSARIFRAGNVGIDLLLDALKTATRSNPSGGQFLFGQSVGLTAREILRIKQLLAELNFNPGNQDGWWDSSTTAAVRRFVRSRNMGDSLWFDSGRVRTEALINELELARFTNETAVQNFTPGDNPSPTQVRRIEELLAKLGYFADAPDGDWNERTLEAIRRFASAQNVEAFVFRQNGRIRRSALLVHLRSAARADASGGTQSTARQQATAQNTHAAGTGGTANAASAQIDAIQSHGLNVGHIREIEGLLSQLGFSPGPQDGQWDSRTTAAARRFGRSRNMSDSVWLRSGRVQGGILINQLLLAQRNTPNDGSTIETQTSAIGFVESDQPSTRQIRQIEGLLDRIGQNPGPRDGRWDVLSQAAVRRFAGSRDITDVVFHENGKINRIALMVNLRLAEREIGSGGQSAPMQSHGLHTEDIRKIETLLAQLGHNPGAVDGIWGASTLAATRRFGAAQGIYERSWRDDAGNIIAPVLLGSLSVAHDRLLKIQRLLTDLGFATGEDIGTLDDRTLEAMRLFAASRNKSISDFHENGRLSHNLLVYSLQRAAREETEVESIQAASDNSGLESAILSGAAALLNRKFGDALAVLSEAIENGTERADAYDYRGRAYLGLGDTTRAIADFTRAIELDNRFAPAYAHRATANERAGHLALGLEDHATALTLEPGNAEYQAALSQAAQRLAGAGTAGTTVESAAASSPEPAVAPSDEIRIALVIGNSRYEHAPSLRNPTNDARAMAGAFERLGFSRVTLELDLGHEALVSALRTFGDKALTADWAVIYFAGHGFEVDGTNYLVPVDAKLERDTHLRWEAIELNDVLGAMTGARKIRLAILDACRNNPFTSRMQMSTTRSIGRGLGLIEPEGGTLVAYAARHGQVALDGDGANSPYVNALLQHLDTEKLEISLLFRHVRDTVRQLTGQSQEPYVYGSLPSEALYFNPGY